ncbi:murein biosynthesis integral membrane protein MurJ [Candidatus Microgenomates bacterium]|nr:murein biosynthesis integral membrane protein MurJ [Candidatus Microgenomates bacterium]
MRNFLFRRQTNILSAATVIAAAVLLSRILGLIKYRLLLSNQFGFTPADVGVFLAAFKLPNFLFDLIVMGALTTAFIPIFTSYLAKDKNDEANQIASTVLNISILAFLALSLVFFVFTDPIIRLIAPGLTASEVDLVIPFTRIMLLGQTLPLILGNFLTGILQSHKRFLVPALAPVVYNLGIIAGIFFLSPTLGLYGPVWGVVVGAIFFLLIQIPLSRHLKFVYRPIIKTSLAGVKDIGRLFFPRVAGLAFNQVNYLVTFSLSTLFGARGITIFSFAQQLEQLPVSLFATTISQAALPTLSEEREKDDQLATFKTTFLTSFHQILFLTLPAAAMLVVLRIPVVRLVYGASQFDWFATVDTGRTLAFLGLGLIGESLVNLLVRGFFAIHDSKTPVTIGAATVGLNIVLSIVLILLFHVPVWGLALAAALADTTYAAILLVYFHRRVGRFALPDLLIPAGKMLLAATLAGVFLYVPMKLLDQLVFDTTRTIPLILLTGLACFTGLAVYFFLTWVLQIEELKAFLGLFARFKTVLFSAEETVSEVVTEGVPNESVTNS